MAQENSRTGIVTGVLLIMLGIAFLAVQFLEIQFQSEWWPFAIIGIGLMFFIGMLLAGRSAGPSAIAGSILVILGLILLFNTSFGYWETWAYAWTLLIFAAGIGISIYARFSGQQKVAQSGAVVTRLGLVLFVIFAIFFELIIGISGLFDGRNILWPVLLILFGFYLLLARVGLFSALMPRRKPSQPTPTPSQVEPSPLTPIVEPLQGKPLPIELPADSTKLTEGIPLPEHNEPPPFDTPAFPEEDSDETRRASDRSL
jgi:peptidoglycan/LPS O-acetylase OafA/YrhL